jgi:hypothetical protein
VTLPREVVERVRGRLQAEGRDLDIEAIIARVQAAAERLAAAALAVPAAEFATPRPEGWSAAECLAHAVERNVLHAQEVLYVALSGELPPEPEVSVPVGRDAQLAYHQHALDSLYIHVRDADPETFILTTWPHQFFGDLNWREWLLLIELHCADHTRQLEAMLNA